MVTRDIVSLKRFKRKYLSHITGSSYQHIVREISANSELPHKENIYQNLLNDFCT